MLRQGETAGLPGCLFSAALEIAPEGDVSLMLFSSLSPPANRKALVLTENCEGHQRHQQCQAQREQNQDYWRARAGRTGRPWEEFNHEMEV